MPVINSGELSQMRLGFMMGFNRERMEFARASGFRCAELQVNLGVDYFPGQPDWQAKADEVKAAFTEMDLRISCLAAFYFNNLDGPNVDDARRTVRGAVELAAHLDVPTVAGFAGKLESQPNDLLASLPRFKEVWSEHVAYAEGHGVKIAIEHCPMGRCHLPPGGNNFLCTPAIWEAAFNEIDSPSFGLEWDPSHLIGLFIDPVANLRRFGSKVVHVHAKDAHVNRDLLEQYGVYHDGVVEHCFPGLGDTNWGLVIKELSRQGYTGDMNIEGWHDAVYRDHGGHVPEDIAGQLGGKSAAMREDEGLLIAFNELSKWVPVQQ
jgi:sugar phosphate isomerase/epimerase